MMEPLDPARLRPDFPILEREVNGRQLVYLDNAASSQKPRAVVEAMVRYYYESHANVHRGVHTLSGEATEKYEEARRKVAGFIGAPDPSSLVFTRNATEALNLVARSWGGANIGEGDEIVVSVAEHHANLVPWQLLAAERGARLRVVPLASDHRLDYSAFEELVGERTKLVATFHTSNVLGAVNPLTRIAELAHAAGALLVVDGAQAVPHMPVDVVQLGVDFYAFSGHKMCGPTGIGALWARPELLRGMPPFLAGGEMIRRVEIDSSTFADIPARFEAGTPSIAEAIGLGAAVDYLDAIGMERVHRHCRKLATMARRGLGSIDGIELYGPHGDEGSAVVAFNVRGAHPHDVASVLDTEGVAIRAGHHCAQPLTRALGTQATARASFYLYNTEAEVDLFLGAVVKARDLLAAFA